MSTERRTWQNMKTLESFAGEVFFTTLTTIMLSSCMHMGMVGHEGTDQPDDRSDLTNEVIVGDIRMTVVVPAMWVGRESVIIVKLLETNTARPLSGAKIYLTVRDHHDAQSFGGSPQEMQESPQPGIYSFPYVPSQSGEYTFVFAVRGIGEQLEPSMTVEMRQRVDEQSHDHGDSGDTTYVLVGAVLMGAMMVGMLVAISGMH